MIEANVEQLAKERVDAWLDEWLVMEETIRTMHTARDKAVKEAMVAAIRHYEQFIVAASQTDQTHIKAGDEFMCMPINGTERFLFIQAKPGQYACYRQLDELFKETKKRMARLRTQLRK